MKITENSLRVNSLLSPVIDKPAFFSWQTEGDESEHQKSYAISVSDENGTVIWHSEAESENRHGIYGYAAFPDEKIYLPRGNHG